MSGQPSPWKGLHLSRARAYEQSIALLRMAESEEVTKMVLFVCSDDASYSTGSEFVIDGGWSAGSPVPVGSNQPL